MPASIEVTNNEKTWLKKMIEEKYQLNISDSYSCKKLSELISEKALLDINYNTIRRVFSVVQSKSKPSTYTLNTLAKSIDFKDFSDFKKDIYKFEKDIFNELIHLSFERKNINHQKLIELVQDLNSPNWEQVYQLKTVIDLCIEIKDFHFLKQVLHLHYDEKNEAFLEKFTVCFQKLYFEAKNRNTLLNNFIIENIATSEILQRILLQIYVSEDYLNDFWGDWLETASVGLVYDMEAFRNILLCQKKFNLNLFDEAKELLIRAENSISGNEQNIHPILLGRIAAWEKILNSNSQDPPLYFKNISNCFNQACYFIFFYRLIVMYHKNDFQKGIMESIDLNKLPPNLGAFDKRLLNKFYLTSALYYHHLSEFEKAKSDLLKFDQNRLDVWEVNWFDEKFKILNEIYN
jgi:hypothetical protein